jgi:hypothetical protein
MDDLVKNHISLDVFETFLITANPIDGWLNAASAFDVWR